MTLGPDGRIYCVLGNHVSFEGEFAESSPLKVSYEGDLVGPRYEDPWTRRWHQGTRRNGDPL
ncbi:MAG: hypothetical protein R3C56_28770 [Pirellulaceae bacterium]